MMKFVVSPLVTPSNDVRSATNKNKSVKVAAQGMGKVAPSGLGIPGTAAVAFSPDIGAHL